MAVFIGRDDLNSSSMIICELSKPQYNSFLPEGQDAVKVFLDVTFVASNSGIKLKITKLRYKLG